MEYVLNPTILECRYFFTQDSSSSPMRLVTDYEFDFYIDGERDMYIDDVHYKIGSGSLVIRTPGQRVYSKGDYNCYILTLDFSKRSLKNYKRNQSTEFQPIYNSPIWDILPSVFTKPTASTGISSTVSYTRILLSLPIGIVSPISPVPSVIYT